MIKTPYITFIVLFSFLSFGLLAQNKERVDSLLLKTKENTHDSGRVKAYIGLYNEYKKDKKLSQEYINKAMLLAQQINFKKGMQSTYYVKAVGLFSEAKYDSAVYYANEIIKIADITTPKKNLGTAYNVLGAVYYRRADFSKAYLNFVNAVKIYEELGNEASAAQILSNIVLIHLQQKDYKRAMAESRRCITLARKTKNIEGLTSLYLNHANILKEAGFSDSMLIYYDKSYSLAQDKNDMSNMSRILTNKGIYYLEKKDYPKSLIYFKKSLEMRKRNNDIQGIAESVMHLGFIYTMTGDYKQALEYYAEAEKQTKDLGLLKELSQVFSGQAALYEEQKNYKEALEKYKSFKKYSDSITNTASSNQISEINAKYENDKKDQEIILLNKEKSLQESQLTAQKAESDKRNVLLIVSLLGLVLVLAFALITFRGYKQKQKDSEIIQIQKVQVEEKNKSITDSINYAKRIQEVVLPAGNLLDDFFKEHFILLKPKDIVSGDFYWSTRHDNYFYLAICDSTGHGVPGAFMSLLNIGFLTEAIKENGITDPGQIFDFVKYKLVTTISKEGQKDGFDGVLIRLDTNTGKISYAAANNAPVMVSNGELKELKKDRMPVGMGTKKELFTTHQLDLQKGDTLYLYSDGYADQFGGPKGKKLMYKQLHAFLLSIWNSSMADQKNMLDDNIERWRGNLEQVDDICVIGIKL